MRHTCLVLLALDLALGCGARADLPCREEGTTPGGGAVQFQCDECQGAPTETPPCEGTGLIWTSPNECIDDGGRSGADDLLEVYCLRGVARFCLSHEACPWRDGVDTGDAVSCSRAGLSSTYMAEMIRGCAGWEGHELYCCSDEGRIGFAGR